MSDERQERLQHLRQRREDNEAFAYDFDRHILYKSYMSLMRRKAFPIESSPLLEEL